jgi:hypothetical protein
MAFNIRRMAAARDTLAVAMDNLKKYPWMAAKINSQLIYLPEVEQDAVTAIMRSRMNGHDADNVIAIFDRFTCPECKRVGRACQCKQAEPVA